jgi:SAM-dependent methyltransferase
VQVIADICDKPFEQLRVLDLACLEGQLAIEFALHGSSVLAIEGREANLAKAQFAAEILGLSNIEFRLDDVRNLDPDKHGYFDVVLCAGILYHLDSPDVMEFLERVSAVCVRVTVLDTHISLRDEVSVEWNGRNYQGRFAREHDSQASAEDRNASLWNSLDNSRAFLFTLASVCNILRHVGFTSVLDCLVPYEYYSPDWPRESDRHIVMNDRVTLIAFKGRKQQILSSPITNSRPELDRPRHPELVNTDPACNAPFEGGFATRIRQFIAGAVMRMLRHKAGGSTPAGQSPWPWTEPRWSSRPDKQ